MAFFQPTKTKLAFIQNYDPFSSSLLQCLSTVVFLNIEAPSLA
jgi:hypothetical protein